jgi:hypothetical protein
MPVDNGHDGHLGSALSVDGPESATVIPPLQDGATGHHPTITGSRSVADASCSAMGVTSTRWDDDDDAGADCGGQTVSHLSLSVRDLDISLESYATSSAWRYSSRHSRAPRSTDAKRCSGPDG